MASPREQFILVDTNGKRLNVDELVSSLCKDKLRVLADDDVGLVLYVGDLHIYELKPTGDGEFFAHEVTHISRPRFASRVLRRQIGARVFSVTADAVFVVREEGGLRKVRAEDLERGMILITGEKVYI